MAVKTILALSTAAMLSLAPGMVEAQTREEPRPSPQDQQSAEALAREGMEKLMQALRQMLLTVPQYDMPQLNERGDIIIKRRNPPAPKPPSAKPPAGKPPATNSEELRT